MELSRSWEHCLFHIIPKFDGCTCQCLNNFLDLVCETMILGIKSKLEADNRAINTLN